MKIGLVDVDGNLNKKLAKKYPNLALMKISAYHKNLGDTVEWANPLDEYDTVYMSKVFSYSADDLTEYKCNKLIKGGTGYNLHQDLPYDIDHTHPDYKLYGDLIDDKTAYGFLTRGCPNKCAWCIVPKKEGKIHPYMTIDEIVADSGRNRIILMDNNIIASGDYGKEQLRRIIDLGVRIDFNQGLDARLVDEEWAELLANCKWIQRIRFGCDTPKQIAECDRAVSLIDGFSKKKNTYLFYTMLGCKGYNEMTEEQQKAVFRENYERVNHWKHGEKYKFYCQAQPFLDFEKVEQNVPRWQKDISIWANNKRYYCSHELIDFHPRKDAWFKDYVDWAYS